ncbi:hypothetical protein COJ96_09115 [Bacillus sp. AFS073361]|uniref:hypothetical protein n=1 Tax=Bacillus sp. AFS073361 TaxID=2033511 RepID=UPI000BF3942A|nr:hypothetical protein [Bacillus sp. AFS073361]PFP29833.1 hypothetical protein COJ96_09115 [Bacillus sp. AFS073361]
MPGSEDLKRWEEIDKLISKLSITIYGIDTTKLNWREEQAFIETWEKRRQLEEELRRRNPKPERKLSKAEELEQRRANLLWAKFEKVRNKTPLKETTNGELRDQLQILRSIVATLGGE